jgi:putative membrane protein
MTEVQTEAHAEPIERSLAKGLIAGLIGGLVGTLAKTLAERMFPPRIHGEAEPHQLLTEQLAGHPLDHDTKAVAAEAIHWGFGAAAGAAYGALAEFYPAATAKEGASFGMALEALTHETALPALGLAADPHDQTIRERASEMTSHVVFGITAETVRSFVRKLL